nr:MAG TPA: hypothetical protein [Caudoviricetes sp.]
MGTITKSITKDMHFSGAVMVDGKIVATMDAGFDVSVPVTPIINRQISDGDLYRQNKEGIDKVVDEFEKEVWDNFDRAINKMEE